MYNIYVGIHTLILYNAYVGINGISWSVNILANISLERRFVLSSYQVQVRKLCGLGRFPDIEKYSEILNTTKRRARTKEALVNASPIYAYEIVVGVAA